jgi:hypothetical protein
VVSSSTAYAIDSPFEFMRQACVPDDLGSSPISNPPIVVWSPGSSVDHRGRPDRDNWDKYGIAVVRFGDTTVQMPGTKSAMLLREKRGNLCVRQASR